MIRFLDTAATLREAKRLLSTCEEAVLAVAFWGEGAQERLGLTKKHAGMVTIFCDPESGACNPDALEELLEIGIEVRAKRHLHAKVLWTPKAVIIGSSNVSANGLGFEGAELRGNIEASALTEDPGVIGSVRAWLNAEVRPGREFDDVLKKRCRDAWERRQRSRYNLVSYSDDDGNSEKTFSYLLENNSRWFKNRFEVWYGFNEPISAKSQERGTLVAEKDRKITWFEVSELSQAQNGKVVVVFRTPQTRKPLTYRMLDLAPEKTALNRGKMKYNHYCVKVSEVDGYWIDAGFMEKIVELLRASKLATQDQHGRVPLYDLFES